MSSTTDAPSTTLPTPTKARYIVVEGIDGIGKTTQCAKLAKYLRDQGFRVLETREPGTKHLELTMTLRSLMLDKQYDEHMTPIAREYISRAIRSIHLDKLIKDALQSYDFIIQDRGLLSGLAYGIACGNALGDVLEMMRITCTNVGDSYELYSNLIILQADVAYTIKRLANKPDEFKSGDVIEQHGLQFMQQVNRNMLKYGNLWASKTVVDVDANDSIDDVFNKIVAVLHL